MMEFEKITSIKLACIQILRYYGYFSYPLTLEEIHRFMMAKATVDETGGALAEALSEGAIHKIDRFYLSKHDQSWVTERLKGNERAAGLLDRSPRFVRVISSFPFVRGIAISGSLSKYYASEEPDIDYFIITKANRLWIARSLLHFFKKLTFLNGHQHYYCMNYFVDTEALSLTQRNQYAAIELATLLPAYNKALILELIRRNEWINSYLPNHPGISNFKYLIKERKQPLKRMFEKLLDRLYPSRFNRFLMKITDEKWRKKWRHAGYSKEEYNKALRTEIHISKNHPDDYEKKVLDALEQQSAVS